MPDSPQPIVATKGLSWWQAHADEKWTAEAGDVNARTRVTVRRHLIEAQYCEVVDFGCGLALDAEILEANGVAYTGVEQCEKFRDATIARGVSVVSSLAGFADKSTDVVYCRHVLEHLPNLAPALREMIRVAEHEVIVVAGETPGPTDRLEYDRDRDLYWNVWSTAFYDEVLRSVPGVVNWTWRPQMSFQGRGGKDESILFIRLNSHK